MCSSCTAKWSGVTAQEHCSSPGRNARLLLCGGVRVRMAAGRGPCLLGGREVMTAETDVQQFPEQWWGNSQWMSLLKLSTGSVKGALQNAILFLSVQALDPPRNTDDYSHWANFQGFLCGSWSKWLSCLLYCRALLSRMQDVIFPVHGAQSRHLTWSKVFSLVKTALCVHACDLFIIDNSCYPDDVSQLPFSQSQGSLCQFCKA